MASTVSDEKAGNTSYQNSHMDLIFKEGFSFSGFERDALFLNLGGKSFKDISGISGVDSLLDGRSVALADFDNDGDLDIFLTTIQTQAHLLYRNNVGQDNGFIRVSLEGSGSGRDALGAVVRMKTSRGVQTQIKAGGGGFMATHDERLLFGMGHDREAEWVEVTWPAGGKSRFGPIPSGSSVRIAEGQDEFQLVVEKKSKLPDPISPEDLVWSQLTVRRGHKMPDLPLRPISGESAGEPLSLKKGQAYLVNFWATFCGPCRREMPELEKLRAMFLDRGIELIGVSLDEAASGVEAFARSLGTTYPLYLVDSAELEKIFAQGRAFIPLSLFVDEEGRVMEAISGWSARSEQRLLELLENLKKTDEQIAATKP